MLQGGRELGYIGDRVRLNTGAMEDPIVLDFFDTSSNRRHVVPILILYEMESQCRGQAGAPASHIHSFMNIETIVLVEVNL